MTNSALMPPYAGRTSPPFRNAPIAVTDSGVGGLSILRELITLLPHENFVFLADQAHVPYGKRSLDAIREFEEGITRFFLDGVPTHIEGAKLVTIACNTASAAALHHVRQLFPEVKFVGLEPAVKPAALGSKSKVIGVIATAVTFEGQLYASLVDRYAQGITVHTRACPEFVELVERGGPFGEHERAIVRDALMPLVDQGIDKLVLGCTHFPFLMPHIQEVVGAHVEVIDPSRAVARQVQRILKEANALTTRTGTGHVLYLTTGDLDNFRRQLHEMLTLSTFESRQLLWQDGRLSLQTEPVQNA